MGRMQGSVMCKSCLKRPAPSMAETSYSCSSTPESAAQPNRPLFLLYADHPRFLTSVPGNSSVKPIQRANQKAAVLCTFKTTNTFPFTFSTCVSPHLENPINDWHWSLSRVNICRNFRGGLRLYCYFAMGEGMESLIPQAFLCTPLQGKLVSQHGDKLPIRRLILRGAHPAPERPVQGIHPSSVPRHLNGMPDGALHLAGAQGGAARLLGGEFIAFQLLCLLVLCFPFLL